jgi:predicted mannosyl-3-phosphoglycerate phosphatase (HAD superfamily)
LNGKKYLIKKQHVVLPNPKGLHRKRLRLVMLTESTAQAVEKNSSARHKKTKRNLNTLGFIFLQQSHNQTFVKP